ncbi:uncharacterized protein [Danio rerio]|uniref:non-specific serine/threonine protein kinase n=1 Tax=Danio rerio TaxID=7955 RepID=A0AB32TF84_DANRE
MNLPIYQSSVDLKHSMSELQHFMSKNTMSVFDHAMAVTASVSSGMEKAEAGLWQDTNGFCDDFCPWIDQVDGTVVSEAATALHKPSTANEVEGNATEIQTQGCRRNKIHAFFRRVWKVMKTPFLRRKRNKVGPDPDQEPDPKPDPEPDPDSEHNSGNEPDPDSERGPDQEPDPEQEYDEDPEPDREPESDPEPDPGEEPDPDREPDPGEAPDRGEDPDREPDPGEEPDPDREPDPDQEPGLEIQTQGYRRNKIHAFFRRVWKVMNTPFLRRRRNKVDPESDPDQEPESDPEPDPDSEHNLDHEPGPDQEPDPDQAPDPDSEHNPDHEPGQDQEPDPDQAPDPDSEHNPDHEPVQEYDEDLHPDQEPDLVSEPVSDQERGPDQEPDPDQEFDEDPKPDRQPESDPVPDPGKEPDPDQDKEPVPGPSGIHNTDKPHPDPKPVPGPSGIHNTDKPHPDPKPVPGPSGIHNTDKPHPDPKPVPGPSGIHNTDKPHPDPKPVPGPSGIHNTDKPHPDPKPVPGPSGIHNTDKPHPVPKPVPRPSRPKILASRAYDNQRSLASFYELGDILGSGAFGTVRKGLRKSDNKEVAIKQIENGRYVPGCSKPMIKEVELMLMMKRPPLCKYVIEMYEWFNEPGYISMVLEYPKHSEDLRNYVRNCGKLDEHLAKCLSRQIILAVKHCFGKGIVHNDLHSSNILVNTMTKEIKLIDFGCAYKVCSQDIYSANLDSTRDIGCLLIYMVTGNIKTYFAAKFNCSFSLAASLTSDCRDLIDKCLRHSLILDGFLQHDWMK